VLNIKTQKGEVANSMSVICLVVFNTAWISSASKCSICGHVRLNGMLRMHWPAPDARALAPHIAKEAVDGTQAYVACADLIASTRFQAIQERVTRATSSCSTLRPLDPHSSRPQTATAASSCRVALQRVRAQGPLARQVVGEEALQHLGEA